MFVLIEVISAERLNLRVVATQMSKRVLHISWRFENLCSAFSLLTLPTFPAFPGWAGVSQAVR